VGLAMPNLVWASVADRNAWIEGLAVSSTPWVRTDMEGTPAVYNFLETVKGLHRNRIKVLAIGGPYIYEDWVPQSQAYNLSNLNLGAYETRMRTFFSYLSQNGEYLDAIEIGNELDYCNLGNNNCPVNGDWSLANDFCYTPPTAAANSRFLVKYVQMLQFIKSLIVQYGWKTKIVTFGMSSIYPWKACGLLADPDYFVQRLLVEFGAAAYVDGIGIHPTGRSNAPADVASAVQQFSDKLVARNIHVPLWITESYSVSRGPQCNVLAEQIRLLRNIPNLNLDMYFVYAFLDPNGVTVLDNVRDPNSTDIYCQDFLFSWNKCFLNQNACLYCSTLSAQCGGPTWNGPFCCSAGTCLLSKTSLQWYCQN